MSRCAASSCSRPRWRAAWDEGRPDPFAAFERLGKAYLQFARAEPAYYSAMFEAGVPLDQNAELQAAGDRAFGVLRKAAETLIAAMPAGARPPALMMALHIWALSHGIASLFGRGDAARRSLPMTPEELLEAGVLVYLRGLGLPGDARSADRRPHLCDAAASSASAPTISTRAVLCRLLTAYCNLFLTFTGLRPMSMLLTFTHAQDR